MCFLIRMFALKEKLKILREICVPVKVRAELFGASIPKLLLWSVQKPCPLNRCYEMRVVLLNPDPRIQILC